MKWVIVVPCWGERYRRNFLKRGFKALDAAFQEKEFGPYRFIIMTDHPQDFWGRIAPEYLTLLPVPEGKNSAEKLGNAVRIGLHLAEEGEAVLLHNSDMVISRETFAACEKRFSEGKKFVTCHSVRTKDIDPPQGLRSRDLLNWGWSNRHQWVEDSIFGRGRVAGPAIVVFDSPFHTVVHCFSMQCLAVFKDREREFDGPTADELVDTFERPEIHIVQSADELACVEPCADDMSYDLSKYRLEAGRVVRFAPVYASPNMIWQFEHQIVIRGEPQPLAQNAVNEMVRRMDRSRHPARLAEWSDGRNAAAFNHPQGLMGLLMRVPQPVRQMVPRNIRREVLKWL